MVTTTSPVEAKLLTTPPQPTRRNFPFTLNLCRVTYYLCLSTRSSNNNYGQSSLPPIGGVGGGPSNILQKSSKSNQQYKQLEHKALQRRLKKNKSKYSDKNRHGHMGGAGGYSKHSNNKMGGQQFGIQGFKNAGMPGYGYIGKSKQKSDGSTKYGYNNHQGSYKYSQNY